MELRGNGWETFLGLLGMKYNKSITPYMLCVSLNATHLLNFPKPRWDVTLVAMAGVHCLVHWPCYFWALGRMRRIHPIFSYLLCFIFDKYIQELIPRKK